MVLCSTFKSTPVVPARDLKAITNLHRKINVAGPDRPRSGFKGNREFTSQNQRCEYIGDVFWMHLDASWMHLDASWMHWRCILDALGCKLDALAMYVGCTWMQVGCIGDVFWMHFLSRCLGICWSCVQFLNPLVFNS